VPTTTKVNELSLTEERPEQVPIRKFWPRIDCVLEGQIVSSSGSIIYKRFVCACPFLSPQGPIRCDPQNGLQGKVTSRGADGLGIQQPM